MEKIIKAGEYTFPAKSTAASLFSYKANFGRDGLQDILVLASLKSEGLSKAEILANLDTDVFLRFSWVFAKSADKSIPPMEEWLDGFEMSPIDFIFDVLPQVSELLGQTTNSQVNVKNPPAVAEQAES